MAGRPPKPLILHKAHGTFRKDRHAKREQELILTAQPMGDAPSYISSDPIAMEEWVRLTGNREYNQVLSGIHFSGLAEYCHLHSRMVADAESKGRDKETHMNAAERSLFHSLRVQYCATPAATSKARVPRVEKPANKWAKFA